MSKNQSIQFECGKQILFLPYLPEFHEEFKQGKPIVHRIFVHDDHAHLLRIDAHGMARGYQRVDYYTGLGLEKGTRLEYTCEVCNQKIFFNINPLSIQKEKNTEEAQLESTYTCVHLHKANDTFHGVNIRINAQKKILYCKTIKLFQSEFLKI